MSQEVDHAMMCIAIIEAKKCEPVPTAFNVGCVLVTQWPSDESPPIIISRGFSREIAGNTHAEANALAKARGLTSDDISSLFQVPSANEGPSLEDLLRKTDVYTTMEPCSIRTSGLPPCVDALIAAKVRKCVIGVAEPDDFVQCEGARKLAEAGIEVVWFNVMEEECLQVARAGHLPKASTSIV